MTGHRARSRATHDATFEERQQTGTNAVDEPIYGSPNTVAQDVPIRIKAGGEGYVREESGERVARNDVWIVPASYEGTISEGQNASITGVTGTFEVVDVVPKYGRNSTDHLRVEVQRID